MKNRVLLLVAVFGLGVSYWLSIPDGKVRVVFCNVGQGDGAMVMEGERQMVIDVGRDNKKMLECLGRWLPFWDKKIEVVIITHKDEDHSGALTRIKRSFEIENLYSDLRKDDVIRMGGIKFEVLNPEELTGDGNRDSMVGVINRKVLMMADVTAEEEQRMVWRKEIKGEIEVLKVGHHGSAEATSKELIEAVRPRLVVISVGENNKYGHPNGEVLRRLEGIEIKRTDRDGDIVVEL